MSEQGKVYVQLETAARQRGLSAVALHEAARMVYRTVHYPRLSEDLKALEIVQQLLHMGWTPPVGAEPEPAPAKRAPRRRVTPAEPTEKALEVLVALQAAVDKAKSGGAA